MQGQCNGFVDLSKALTKKAMLGPFYPKNLRQGLEPAAPMSRRKM